MTTKERKLRRTLDKAGYSLHKSRGRISIDNLGGYRIVDHYTNCVVADSRFDLDLDDVEEWTNYLKE